MISFISSFEIGNVVIPDPNIFFWKTTSVVDAAVFNLTVIETFLAYGLSTVFIKSKPIFSNITRSLHKNPFDCPMLWNWVFPNLILAEEPFTKVLQSTKTYVLVNNSLCGKLYSSLELLFTFNEKFRVPSLAFYIADFIN